MGEEGSRNTKQQVQRVPGEKELCELLTAQRGNDVRRRGYGRREMSLGRWTSVRSRRASLAMRRAWPASIFFLLSIESW